MYLDTVRKVLHDLGIDNEITGGSLLRDELGMDSQEIIELLTVLEQRLRLILPNRGEIILGLRSVDDIVLLLQRPQCSRAEAVS